MYHFPPFSYFLIGMTIAHFINKDNFSISYDNQPIPLVTEAVYLGLIITNNLSWDKHVTEHCKSINYKIFQLKQLKKAGAKKDLLLSVYKTYIQPKIDYGISIWGCSTQANFTKIQRKQNRAARIILGNMDYRKTRGIDLVQQLG